MEIIRGNKELVELHEEIDRDLRNMCLRFSKGVGDIKEEELSKHEVLRKKMINLKYDFLTWRASRKETRGVAKE